MKSFRLIHTGDIHLDSALRGISGQQGAAAERIRTATRIALDNLVSQAIEEQVAFVIIAGDLYDGDWRDSQTGLFFVRQMGRLARAGSVGPGRSCTAGSTKPLLPTEQVARQGSRSSLKIR